MEKSLFGLFEHMMSATTIVADIGKTLLETSKQKKAK